MKTFAQVIVVLLISLNVSFAREVTDPAGSIPVLREVDVVVVGGAAGGIEAALAAAKNGASVFLAAPRPYLGEDICATYRLWLEPDEKPLTDLAAEVFKSTPVAEVGPGLPFKYTADKPSASKHRDTTGKLLADGKWHDAPSQSVQYDNAVTFILDLGGEQKITKINLMAYQRPDEFAVEKAIVSASADKEHWQPVATITNEWFNQGTYEGTALALSAPAKIQARYLKVAVPKPEQAQRILLGEIVVEGEVTAEPKSRVQLVTPMQVKRTLDQALINANISYLYGSYVTDLLRDATGKPAGVVIANRAGRQAVPAKVIIDATDRALVGRLAGAKFTDYPRETQVFDRIVVGGPVCTNANVHLAPRAEPLSVTDRKSGTFPVHEYKVSVTMRDGSAGGFGEAEQQARDWTWSKDAVDASEVLFQVPPDSFRSKQSFTGAWPGADKLPLDCLQPAGTERIFVLSGRADVSREAAAKLVRPVNLMAVGARVGDEAATLAKTQPTPAGVRVSGAPRKDAVTGEVRYVGGDVNPRTTDRQIPTEAHGLPVLGEYDVVVVGGGTGGAPAGIGAARQGAKTLVLEYHHGLGGVGTIGYITSYYHGRRIGFTTEVDVGVAEFGGPASRGWNPEHKSEWYRRELRKAGADLWYGALGAGALVENGRVAGVVVNTLHGRGVVLATTVIDSTGNADIAAAAGATCRYTDATEVAVQGTGLPSRNLGQGYVNTDYTFVDETDIFDIWRALVAAREKFKGAYDIGQLIDTRERRQIVGDYTLTPMDIMLSRKFPDTIGMAQSNFDSHGYIVHPIFMLRAPHKKDLTTCMPYRCLLPRGLDRILVTGLGVSAHRDAVPIIRMQADIQNQGYAAGVAAAMIAKAGSTTRQLDIKALQKHLVQKVILPESVLIDKDSFPLSKDKVAAAIEAVTNEFDQLEIVLAQFDMAQPLLQLAYAKATTDEAKLTYAHILGMMSDPTGAGTLVKAVTAAKWDKGWRFVGMGQFGPSVSPVDSLVIALGRTGDKRGLTPILNLAQQLTAESEFSHFRAVALALESVGDKAAAKPLAEMLQKPGMTGHAATTITVAIDKTPGGGNQNLQRELELRELDLARALYRCGDHNGLGEKILREYAADLHGHYARHARAVLQQKRP